MIPFTIKKKTYYLPQSYGELQVKKLLKLTEYAEKPMEFFPFLMDCPHEIDPDPLLPFIEWVNEPINLPAFGPADNVPDIRLDTWGKRIECESLLGSNIPIVSMLKIVALYFDTEMKSHDVMSEPGDLFAKIKAMEKRIEANEKQWEMKTLEEVCPVYLNIINQFNDILAQEKTLEILPDAEQMEAGVSEFNQLGHFNTIDLLANGDVLKYDEVLLKDYNTIFAKLLKLNISNKFTDRYRKIVQRNAKNNRK